MKVTLAIVLKAKFHRWENGLHPAPRLSIKDSSLPVNPRQGDRWLAESSQCLHLWIEKGPIREGARKVTLMKMNCSSSRYGEHEFGDSSVHFPYGKTNPCLPAYQPAWWADPRLPLTDMAKLLSNQDSDLWMPPGEWEKRSWSGDDRCSYFPMVCRRSDGAGKEWGAGGHGWRWKRINGHECWSRWENWLCIYLGKKMQEWDTRPRHRYDLNASVCCVSCLLPFQ